MTRIIAALLSMSLAGAAYATPKVVTSIPPVQGLVADIMMGAGTPTLLMDGTTSPHHFSMRPSQARDLAEAQIVFTIGLGMEPWLSETGRAEFIYLGNTDGLKLYNMRELKEFREPQEFVVDDSDIDTSLEYSAEAENFDPTDPEVEAFINDMLNAGEPLMLDTTSSLDSHESSHRVDPHIWLDPQNTIILIDKITDTLITNDLVNEEIYRDNSTRMKRDVSLAAEKARFSLDRMSRINFVATHDSLQYLEHAFGLTVIGALSSGDGIMVGARSLSGIYEQIGPSSCILVDMSEPEGVANNPFGEVPTVEIDPLGTTLVGTFDYYPRLLEQLAEQMSYCRE